MAWDQRAVVYMLELLERIADNTRVISVVADESRQMRAELATIDISARDLLAFVQDIDGRLKRIEKRLGLHDPVLPD